MLQTPHLTVVCLECIDAWNEEQYSVPCVIRMPPDDGRLWNYCVRFKRAVDSRTVSLAARGGNLAKIPPNQVIADFGRGSSVESESE